MNKSYNLLEIEEHGVFLKKCLEMRVLPRKKQLYCSNQSSEIHSRETANFSQLYKADEENYVLLKTEKKSFVDLLHYKTKRLNSNWQQTLFIEIKKETWFLRRKIKKYHFLSIRNLKKQTRTILQNIHHENLSTNKHANVITSSIRLAAEKNKYCDGINISNYERE